MTRTAPLAPERRHTWHFLRETAAVPAVFLDTEVDMTGVLAHREKYRAETRYSIVSYVLLAAGRVLARHPEANAAIRGRRWPRIARYDSVDGKLTLDRTLNDRRIVLSAVLPGLQDRSLDDVQRQVDELRDGDPAVLDAFRGARLLHRLPLAVGGTLFRLGVRPLARRPERFGTFAVTSLGHGCVDGFHSVGGTTVTLGVGRIRPRPVARDGEVVVAPVLRLSLAFDHRVIDGAEAADVLDGIRRGLEGFGEPAGPAPDALSLEGSR